MDVLLIYSDVLGQDNSERYKSVTDLAECLTDNGITSLINGSESIKIGEKIRAGKEANIHFHVIVWDVGEYNIRHHGKSIFKLTTIEVVNYISVMIEKYKMRSLLC